MNVTTDIKNSWKSARRASMGTSDKDLVTYVRDSTNNLYLYVSEGPETNGRETIIVAFGEGINGQHSHKCTVFKSGFRFVRMPAGTKTI